MLILSLLLFFLSPFNKFNTVIQMKKKLRSFAKARMYLQLLIVPMPYDQSDPSVSLMDHHLYN